MTTVERSGAAAPIARPARGLLHRPRATTGFWSWFTTVDHKKIGILYGVTALGFLVVGGVEALLIRLQLAGPNGSVLTAAQYNTMFTMHGTTMIFLMGMPLSVAPRTADGAASGTRQHGRAPLSRLSPALDPNAPRSAPCPTPTPRRGDAAAQRPSSRARLRQICDRTLEALVHRFGEQVKPTLEVAFTERRASMDSLVRAQWVPPTDRPTEELIHPEVGDDLEVLGPIDSRGIEHGSEQLVGRRSPVERTHERLDVASGPDVVHLGQDEVRPASRVAAAFLLGARTRHDDTVCRIHAGWQ